MPTVSHESVELFYGVEGEGEAVVLLPGFAADHTFWLGMLPALRARHRVLWLDPRGAGQSTSPDVPYDAELLAEDVLAVMDAAGVASAHLVGHSLGGATAQWLARHHPERVQRVVLFNAFARARITARLALRAAGRFYEGSEEPIEPLAESLFPWLFSARFLDHDDNFATLLRLSLEHPHPQPRAGYTRQLEALEAFDSIGWLSQIGTPTLVVSADQDLLVAREDIAVLASGIPGAAAVTVPGAGHCLPVERPDLCAALVLGHLA